jgi:hypothetical protein
MNSVYELLSQKERDLTRVHKEVECLRIAANLLCDEEDESVSTPEESPVTFSAPVAGEPSQEDLHEESAVQKVMGIFRSGLHKPERLGPHGLQTSLNHVKAPISVPSNRNPQ